MSTYDEILINHIQSILDGKEVYIPNPHDRIGDVFHIHKNRYIVIGSTTGVGKTSYVDDTLILKPYLWLQQQTFDYHHEVLYYSMERGKRDKYAKWLSWMLFQQSIGTYPSNLFSIGVSGKTKVNSQHLDLAKQLKPTMDRLFEHIDIKQGPQDVPTIEADILAIAKRVGVFITSDRENIFIDGKLFKDTEGKPVKFNSTVTRDTVRGKIPYIRVKYNGNTIEIYPNTSIYVLKKPNTFVQIVIDHIGKTKLGKFMIKKQAVDELDEVLCNARDLYGFMPVVISQFNRGVGNVQRLKQADGDLSPILEDFKESGCPTESADLVLSVFDPYRYKSYDNDGLYKGYNIASESKPCTLTPDGLNQRFRSLHILKNSYGPSQITFGLRFTGEVMDFKLLPLPGTKELEKIYAEIAQGK
jgi:hypothetical protein